MTTVLLQRRGFDLGTIRVDGKKNTPSHDEICQAWQADEAICYPQAIAADVASFTSALHDAHALMEHTLEHGESASVFESEAYMARLHTAFALVASSTEDHDAQGIEKIYFDAITNEHTCAEELWCKVSWLSFHEDDASLRFRFSFGMEGFEDVARDPERQYLAGELCERLFPESVLLTRHSEICSILTRLLGHAPHFVERIVYFNAPNGGAQFHHDVERGHAGVVFAQLTGATCWLALNKQQLMDAMASFADTHTVSDALQALMRDRNALSEYMESVDHAIVEELIDQQSAFIRYLAERGFAHVLQAGDVMFLPQRDLDQCVWHTVFTLGDSPGEALSFAVR